MRCGGAADLRRRAASAQGSRLGPRRQWGRGDLSAAGEAEVAGVADDEAVRRVAPRAAWGTMGARRGPVAARKTPMRASARTATSPKGALALTLTLGLLLSGVADAAGPSAVGPDTAGPGRSASPVTRPPAAAKPSLWQGRVRPFLQRPVVRTTITVAGLHAGFAAWTYFAWYGNQTQSPTLIVRDEGWFGADTYAGGADKLGHFTFNYALTRGTAQLFRSAGMRQRTSLLLANGLTMLSFFVIEIKDGYHAGFGFSWGDIVANLSGNLFATVMELWPALDRVVDLRIRYQPSADYIRRAAGDETNLGEDYSGMRFDLWFKGAAVDWPDTGHDGPARLLRYVSLGIGYRAVGFKPTRWPVRTQELQLMVGLDLQPLLDDWIYEGKPGRGRKFTRFFTELVTLPYTSYGVPMVQVRRADP